MAIKEINIARSIITKRKEKGITQDDLANFIGVSTASVSKWETGHSYPDIVFLPQLASYFNITLDELMGYEPQMTDADIRKLCIELKNDFGAKPLDEVKSRCREIIKKYYSCFPLLFQIGILYVNYGWTSKSEEKKASTLNEAKELFIRVKTESDDLEFKQGALYLEATCEMMLGNSEAIIALLEDVKPAPKKEGLLAQAYVIEGKIKEAKSKLQEGIYTRILELFDILPQYLAINTDEPAHFEEIIKRTTALIDIFKLKSLAPLLIMPFYIVAARGYATLKNSDKALDVLESYTTLATGDIYPLHLLKSDEFFTFIDGLEKETLFGAAELPRDEKSIKQSMLDEVVDNPVYAILEDEPRYKLLVNKLKYNAGA